ncbi:MAG: Mur ligase family protein, partial [Elusimicrobiota bacterium]
ETIYSTKIEIIKCLGENGIFVYNLDNEFLSRLRNSPGRKISFGYDKESDIRIIDVQSSVEFVHKNKKIKIALPARARHDILNAAASAAAALASGIEWPDIVKGLENFKPLPMRMQEIKLNNSIVIFDAYNANPVSMKSAILHLVNSNYPKPHYLVLGDMKELGIYSCQYHRELGEFISNLEIEKIFLAGIEINETLNSITEAGSGRRTTYSENFHDWLPELISLVSDGPGTFLIKASRAMKFEKILEIISK